MTASPSRSHGEPRGPRPGERSGGELGDVDAELADFLAAIDELLDRELDEIDAAWRRAVGDAAPDILADDLPAWLRRLLLGQGKRIRASMTWQGWRAGAEDAGEPPAELVRVAAALETLHLFAIVHDDVMDESETRRGGPSAHAEARDRHLAEAGSGGSGRFGESLAILLGDLAHTLADALVAELDAALRSRWRELCVELIAGQRADLTGAAAARRDARHAALVARLKSSRYTVERPLELGAIIGGAGAGRMTEIAEWGAHVGRAFALRDDVLGVWGDPAETGKPVGDDLAQGKATEIVALGAGRLAGEEARELARLGGAPLDAEAAGRLALALDRAGVREECETMIEAELRAADAALAASSIAPGRRAELAAAARLIARRRA